MKAKSVLVVTAAAVLAAIVAAVEGQSGGATGSIVVQPADVKWEQAKSLPAGITASVLHGDTVKGPSAVLVKIPAGTLIPPHRHSADEIALVHSGTILFGTGEKVDEATAVTIPAGGYVKVSPNTPHWSKAKTDVVYVRYAPGAADVTYCNPADDPRKKP
jgi:quercetin dioxygenase-like cupin family protein